MNVKVPWSFSAIKLKQPKNSQLKNSQLTIVVRDARGVVVSDRTFAAPPVRELVHGGR
jgi:hypothetical protein